MKNHYVMDYETLSNCFVAVFIHYRTDERHIFVIGLLKNDLVPYLEFLDKNISLNEWHISFNGISFDAQITQYVLVNRKRLLSFKTGELVAKNIYKEAQKVIASKNMKDQFAKYPEYKLSIKQIDVFRLNHWDNKAKRSSLKWIQCSMRWYNVLEMPIHHTSEVTDPEVLNNIIEYCINDVESTKRIMVLHKEQITFRGNLTEKYKIRLYSASEAKIAKELFLLFLSEKLKIPKSVLRKQRTFRSLIHISDLILPYIKFTTLEFNNLLKTFKNLKLEALSLKGQFKAKVNFRGVKTHFGLGGVHGAKRGIYVPEEHMMIVSSDVVSYYPNLMIRNKWAPEHISQEDFCELYEWLFDQRNLIPKTNILNYVYKIILNIVYGLSNEINSFLYDPELTMRITVNGQLSLMMLYERLIENIPGSIPLMQNTDGIEVMIPRKYYDLYMSICKDWETTTKLKLEHDEYQKLVLPDVNDYIGVFQFKELSESEYVKAKSKTPEYLFKEENGKFYMAKTKAKGRFEIDKALHKNASFMVVQKALYFYFVHGIKPETYVASNKDVYDYCGLTRANGNWGFISLCTTEEGIVTREEQKTLRYYISKSGDKLIKKNYEDERLIQVESGASLQKIFNLYEEKPFEDYGIDISFYLRKINSEIRKMQPEVFNNQLNLF